MKLRDRASGLKAVPSSTLGLLSSGAVGVVASHPLSMRDRSCCGAVRFFYMADELSAEIVRVESLSLWRRANFNARRRTLCGDCACRIALAVVFAKNQVQK